MHFLGTQTPQRRPAAYRDGRERPETAEEAHAVYDRYRASLEYRAHDVIEWIRRWRTWPKQGDAFAAYEAALAALTENADINKFDLARVAINAARRR
jgi:hypothetical protein